jgi:hypothetical protein
LVKKTKGILGVKQQKELAKKIIYIDKWVNNKEIDLEDSNKFWKNTQTSDSQITQVLKFRTGCRALIHRAKMTSY